MQYRKKTLKPEKAFRKILERNFFNEKAHYSTYMLKNEQKKFGQANQANLFSFKESILERFQTFRENVGKWKVFILPMASTNMLSGTINLGLAIEGKNFKFEGHFDS